MLGLIKKLVGGKHEKDIRNLRPIVDEVNRFFQEYQSLTDEQLRAKTEEFRQRLKESLKDHKFLTPADPGWYERNHDERLELRKQRRAIQQKALDTILP